MLKKYTTEEYRSLYEDLPKKNQLLFWEEDIKLRIDKISERFNLSYEKGEVLAKIVSHLLLGILPPPQVEIILKTELFLEDADAEKLKNEFYRFIIYPIQHILREIYTEEDFKNAGIERIIDERGLIVEKSDVYREPID